MFWSSNTPPPAPEYRDAYPNILLCPQSNVSGINQERVASGLRNIQVGIVARRRWAAVLMFKEGLLEKARWVTRTPPQISVKTGKHQWGNGQASGSHTNSTPRGFPQVTSGRGCVK